MKKFVSLSTGVRIEYVEQGKADGVPAIFLHGVTDSWRSFERVLPLLPPNIHAFALSQRGHGDSSRPTSGYRFADMSADLLAFLDAMGLVVVPVEWPFEMPVRACDACGAFSPVSQPVIGSCKLPFEPVRFREATRGGPFST